MITKVVANLNGSEFGPVGGSTLRQQIRSFYTSIGGIAKSSFGDVLLDDKSVKSDLGHANYRNKTCSFAAVKDVLENGIETKPMAHYGIHGKKQETGVISANITIKGQPFRMDVVVIKNEDEVLRVRCHDVYQTTLAENHHKGLITKRIRRTLIESPSCCPNGDSCAKVQQNIETNNNNNIKTKNIRMNKKQIRLTESDLKQIVKESVNKILNEAYGTVPKQDKVSQNAYRGADFDKSTYSENNEQLIAEYMQKLASGIYDVMDASEWFGYYSEGEIFGDGKNPSLKKYSDLIYNKIQEIENIYQQIRRIMTMRLGLQPDTRYDIKHLSLDDEATLRWRDIAGPKAKRKADDYFDQYDKEKIMKQNRDVNKGRSFTSV